MKAIVISRYGGPGVLELRELPDPNPGADDVLVRVRATALNRADLLQRRGRYPSPDSKSGEAEIPGLEFAGEVIDCGGRVATLRPGDRVMGLAAGGAYAEKIAINERLCIKMPGILSWEAAAAVPESFLTAFDALVERGRLAAGETLLVHAAGSGLGTAACQVARLLEARTIGLSRSGEKRRKLVDLGFDRVLDPADPDLAAAIRGVDVILDPVGAAVWDLNIEAMATLGRLVLVGTMGGFEVSANLGVIMRKRITIAGTVLRGRSLEEKASLVSRFAAWGSPHFASGRLQPVVDRVMTLDQAGEAHAAMERNENFGKIVLRID